MFLAKPILLDAFHELSQLDGGNTQQGLTVKVSVVRYFLALDALLKHYGVAEFDTRNSPQKRDFYREVANVVSVCTGFYTNNFIGLKEDDGSCCTNSNFIAGGPVLKSKTSGTEFAYPSNCGVGKEVLRVKNEHVSFHVNGFSNIQKYLCHQNLKVALCLWLARGVDCVDSIATIYGDIKNFLENRYTMDMVEALLPSNDSFHAFVGDDESRVIATEASHFEPKDFAQTSILSNEFQSAPLQLITYGAPGTGKSFGVRDETKEEAFFRTTFHPDSDYASFVGAYKPTMRAVERTALVGKKLEMADVESVKDALKKEEVICYEFVAQAFTQAYVQAWRFQAAAPAGATPPRVYLVIEEINRGNCAQVFGDLFQLLDRNDGGFSDYPIRPDADLGAFLGTAFASVADTFDAARKAAINALYSEMGDGVDVVDEVLAGRLMALPSNLLLRATMNTSDQSLFPMDSAFKRRWDWQYVPITDKGLGWTISADGATFGWWQFLAAVNGQVAATLKSADKQLGYFFVRPDGDSGTVISAARFVNKVLFFLYNDVFKDYDLPKAFAKPEGGTFAFGDFFHPDGTPDESAVRAFLTQLLPPPAEA